MVIYLDLLFILNLFYDFLILLAVNMVLKRNKKIIRIILGSLVGALSSLLILLDINNYFYFILKILVALFMIIITFDYKNYKYTIQNLVYLYMISIIMAGFLYYLDLEFEYANYILLILSAPLIIGIYIYEQKKLKININYYKEVIVILKNNKKLYLKGYIDSGNKLKDPITNKYIILVNKKVIDGIYNIRSPIYVPINTINKHSLLECISIKELIIDNKAYKNYLVGFTDNLKSDYDCLLNYKLLEEEIW